MSDLPDAATNVTALLARAQQGDRAATDQLFPLVYNELRALAEQHMAGERADHTLQPTALVHEAYLKLVGPGDSTWENRRHFLGAAARAIRRILIDHARARHRDKRGGDRRPEPLSESLVAAKDVDLDVLALDEALTRLAELDPQKARLVELRFFAGLSGEEAAELLGISASTAARDWRFARAWLFREVRPGDTR